MILDRPDCQDDLHEAPGLCQEAKPGVSISLGQEEISGRPRVVILSLLLLLSASLHTAGQNLERLRESSRTESSQTL